jgi:hypothetical protein
MATPVQPHYPPRVEHGVQRVAAEVRKADEDADFAGAAGGAVRAVDGGLAYEFWGGFKLGSAACATRRAAMSAADTDAGMNRRKRRTEGRVVGFCWGYERDLAGLGEEGVSGNMRVFRSFYLSVLFLFLKAKGWERFVLGRL